MTTVTSLPALERDALILAQLSQKLCRTDNAAQEWDKFQDVLERTLSHGDPVESEVLHAAIRALSSQQDDEAYTWLLNEVELEAERQFLIDPVSGQERGCVLFAIPVTASVNIALPTGLFGDAAFEEMHTILSEAKLFDEQATVRLLPRLFAPEELRGRAKSQLRLLTRSLGSQVLESPTDVLALEENVLVGTPPLIEDLSGNEHAQLRYLVGVAVTPNEFLQFLFPELIVPIGEGEDGKKDKDSPAAPGWLKDGSWWAQPFCEKLEESLHLLDAGFALGPPQGYHDDMRNGLVLLREQNATLCLTEAVQLGNLNEADVVVEEWPLSTPDGDVVGIAVYLVNATDEDIVYARVIWPTLHHEGIYDAVDELHAMLNVLELAPSDELLSSDSTQANFLLN